MSSTTVIFIIAIAIVLVLALVAARRSGPRITHIETRRVDGEDGE